MPLNSPGRRNSVRVGHGGVPDRSTSLRERHALHSKLSRRARLRALALAVSAAALAVVLGGSGLAGAADARPASPTTITIELTKGKLKFVGAGNGHRRRPAGNRQQDEPETGRPAHLLAGHQGLAAEDPEGAEELLHAETHLPRDRQVARLQPENGKDHEEPGEGRPRRLEHDGQRHGKKGDSWFTGEKKGGHFTQEVTAAAGHHALLHVRRPPLDARPGRTSSRRWPLPTPTS